MDLDSDEKNFFLNFSRRGGIELKKLMKSSTDKVLLGVCAGIAEFFGILSLIVRLLFIFLPVSLVIYLLLSLYLPANPSLY